MHKNKQYLWHQGTVDKRPIVLFDFGTWEITLREALSAMSIVGIMATIGFFASGAIEKHVHDAQLKYRQALQIDKNADEFRWALDTDVGYAFVEGHLKTLDPVRHEKLDGSWLSIDAVFQKYQKHTSTYTTTDGKGHTYTKTRTYWSWDSYDYWHRKASRVNFLSNEFSIAKFDFSSCRHKERIVDNGYHKRIVFSMLPPEMDGTVFSKLEQKTMSNNSLFMQGMDLKKAYADCVESYAILVFWIIWLLAIALAVWAFFYAENNWLED